MTVKTYEELEIWQVAMQLAKRVYALQKQLPKEEVYGLGDLSFRFQATLQKDLAVIQPLTSFTSSMSLAARSLKFGRNLNLQNVLAIYKCLMI